MSILKKLITPCAFFLATILSVPSVFAEDIDVYLVEPEPGAGANILLVIDNSGATNQPFKAGIKYTTGGTVAHEIVYAMQLVLDNVASTARMGAASQNSTKYDGGRIDYAVAQINESAEPVVRSVVVGPAVEAAQSFIGGAWGTIDVADDTITFPEALAGADKTQVGLIFKEIAVPRYAKISSATLTMTSPDNGTKAVVLRVGHEESAAPLDFSATNDFSGRSFYDPAVDNAKGLFSSGVFTADLTGAVQAAVNDDLWCGRNDLSLAIFASDYPGGSLPELYTYRAQTVDADGTITVLGGTELNITWEPTDSSEVPAAKSSCMGGVILTANANSDDAHVSPNATKDGFNADAAELVLAYAGQGSTAGDYVGALRFPNVAFASGAQIESAELSATVNSASLGGSLKMTSMLGDVGAFAAGADITGAALGVETVTVAVSDGTRFTADVTDMVRESMNDGGWASGGGLGIYLDRAAGTSAIAVHAVDGGAGSAAKIVMNVTAPKPGDFVSSVTRRDEIAEAIQYASENGGGANKKPGSAYVESARYMLGFTPQFDSGQGDADAFLSPPSRAEYESPNEKFFANGECGGNHIILVTHANASGDNSFPDATKSILATSKNPATESEACDAKSEATFTGADGLSKTTSEYWTCAGELAEHLFASKHNGLSVPVITHTVSFGVSEKGTGPALVTGLEYVAKQGGGQFREANNALDLAETILEVVNSVTITDAALAAPGVAVNQLNRFRHLDQLYYGVFRPAIETRWQGNLKRYRLDSGPKIVDQNGILAVDPDTGFFKEGAQSFWSATADGVDVTQGGAQEMLAERKLYVAETEPAPSNPARATVVSGVTTTVIDANTDYENDLNLTDYGYVAGEEDVFKGAMADMLAFFGDPLHSEPRLVNFGFTGGDAQAAAADPDLQKNVVFFATNDGMIHAVDAKTGKENWSFMPKDEAVKAKTRDTNAEIVDGKRTTYGLDGGMTVWRRGDGGDGVEHVLLYAGQRRGGRNYYGLNATGAYAGTAPGLMWVIRGGVTSGFSKLGQTWSTPVFAAVKVDGVKTPVLIFGGGFDPSVHDVEDAFDASGDTVGNALYIVNAYSGALIWSASNDTSDGAKIANTDMKWSVPSSPGVVDLDFDGLVDHIYFSDLGGQVFRVDMNNDNTTADDLAYRVKTFAKLGVSEGAASENKLSNRKFFAAPVVGSNDLGNGYVLQVALGSGNRVYPLNEETDDRLFVLNDEEVSEARQASIPAGSAMATITTSDLDDVTDETDAASFDPTLSNGWYINLTENGEKSVSAGAIVDGVLYLTSFLPDIAADNCVQVIGGSRLYQLDIINGEAANDTRFIELTLPGLPPQAQIIIGEGGDGESELSVLVGTAVAEGGTASVGTLNRTRWYEKDTETDANAVITEAQTAQ